MSKEIEWSDTIFLFEQDSLKERRGVDENSLVVSGLESVGVVVGCRSHGPMDPFLGWTSGVQSIWRDKLNKSIKPACELHVTKTDTFQRASVADESLMITERGQVRVTYVGATASTKALEINIDLSKSEALRVAKALINAAEEIEESEDKMRTN